MFKEFIYKQQVENRKKNNTDKELFDKLVHDLKSPLNNIIGFANLLSNYKDDCDKENFSKFIEVILLEAQHANSLINFLWEWSKNNTIELDDHKKNDLFQILKKYRIKHQKVFEL